MRIIVGGDITVASGLLRETPTKRKLRAWGITIGWIFFGIMVAEEMNDENE